MMNTLLKIVRHLPLTPEAFEPFLYYAGYLAVVDAITVDDWSYLVRLLLYRVHTKGGYNGQRTQTRSR